MPSGRWSSQLEGAELPLSIVTSHPPDADLIEEQVHLILTDQGGEAQAIASCGWRSPWYFWGVTSAD